MIEIGWEPTAWGMALGVLARIMVGGAILSMAGLTIGKATVVKIGWEPATRGMALGALTRIVVSRAILLVTGLAIDGTCGLVVEICW